MRKDTSFLFVKISTFWLSPSIINGCRDSPCFGVSEGEFMGDTNYCLGKKYMEGCTKEVLWLGKRNATLANCVKHRVCSCRPILSSWLYSSESNGRKIGNGFTEDWLTWGIDYIIADPPTNDCGFNRRIIFIFQITELKDFIVISLWSNMFVIAPVANGIKVFWLYL